MESDFTSLVSQAQRYINVRMLEGLFNVETRKLNIIRVVTGYTKHSKRHAGLLKKKVDLRHFHLHVLLTCDVPKL